MGSITLFMKYPSNIRLRHKNILYSFYSQTIYEVHVWLGSEKWQAGKHFFLDFKAVKQNITVHENYTGGKYFFSIYKLG